MTIKQEFWYLVFWFIIFPLVEAFCIGKVKKIKYKRKE